MLGCYLLYIFTEKREAFSVSLVFCPFVPMSPCHAVIVFASSKPTVIFLQSACPLVLPPILVLFSKRLYSGLFTDCSCNIVTLNTSVCPRSLSVITFHVVVKTAIRVRKYLFLSSDWSKDIQGPQLSSISFHIAVHLSFSCEFCFPKCGPSSCKAATWSKHVASVHAGLLTSTRKWMQKETSRKAIWVRCNKLD